MEKMSLFPFQLKDHREWLKINSRPSFGSSRDLLSASDLQRRSPNFPMNFLNGIGEEVELIDSQDAKGTECAAMNSSVTVLYLYFSLYD